MLLMVQFIFIASRPAHVNIQDILMMERNKPSTVIDRAVETMMSKLVKIHYNKRSLYFLK